MRHSRSFVSLLCEAYLEPERVFRRLLRDRIAMDAQNAELEELHHQLARMRVDATASRAKELERDAEMAEMRS